MASAHSFGPSELLRRLRATASPEVVFPGAVLFCDISGYTTIAEELCAQGDQGVEELGALLNAAFGTHVRAVAETGGEIASFAGDAFIAYWLADDRRLSSALNRALECARALHLGPTHAGPPSPHAMPLVHIGLSAGDVTAVRLGGPDRWHILLLGSTVREACRAAARAAPRTTVVADECRAHLENDLSIEPGTAKPEVGRTDRAQSLEGTVNPRVQKFLRDGFDTWIAQRRKICALFARIDGWTDTAVDATTRLQDIVQSFDTATRPYATSAGSLVVDDKGLVYTLCLGMPDDAHADDALRAVRAGQAIEGELARLGLSCSIGIASGRGVCMPLGGPERKHYWSVGRFMHVAARLMETAGVGVLCTEEIARDVRLAVGLSPERPVYIKGIRLPLGAFRVHAATPDEHVILLGRDEEQARLEQALDDLDTGRGAVVWIAGEAGIGKTALVKAFQRRARQRETPCFAGGAASVVPGLAYAAWRPVFSSLLLGDGSLQSAANARESLKRLRYAQLAPLVNAVVPSFVADTPFTRELSGQARADATLSVLSEIMGVRAGPRFVVILEDCHWLDSASWHLLSRIIQDNPQALVVLTSRTAGTPEGFETLRSARGFFEIRLAPLRQDAISQLVERFLDRWPARVGVLEEIVDKSVGNPLFAREYALLLRTREPSATAELPANPPPAMVDGGEPVTLDTLITERLDGLPPAHDLVLKIASAIGDRFHLPLLSRAFRACGGETALETVLEELSARQFIELAGGLEGSFRHAMIREVTYSQVTGDQQRVLHRHVAEAIEAEYGSDLAPYCAALAHHWSKADAPTATVRYADLAGSAALAAGAFAEANVLLKTCTRVANEGLDVPIDDQVRWQRQMADARQGMGQLESRRVASHQALRLAGLSRPHAAPALLAQAAMRLGHSWIERRFRRGRTSFPAARALDVARAYRHSAEVCYFNNDMIGVIADSANAVAFAMLLDKSAVLAGASTELGGILGIAGLRRPGERMLRWAVEMAEVAKDPAVLAHAHMVSCLYHVGIGDWASAEASAARCQEVCDAVDDRVNWTNAQAVRFWMSHYRSHDAAALDAACRLRDRAKETGNRQHSAWAFRFLGLCALRRGEAAEAVKLLRAALDCLDETVAVNERVPTLGILALAQLRTGDLWSARATADNGLQQIHHARRPISQSTLEGYSSLIAVALDAWRDDHSPPWKEAIVKCLRVLRGFRRSFPVGEPRYLLDLGDYQRGSGALGRARRSYRLGLAAATRLGMPFERERCRAALAALEVNVRRPI